MKGGARIALGVGIGYLLGRTRKMRWALGLAGAAMSKRSTGVAGELLKRGTSSLGSTELTEITETVRGELLGAVRSAAVTAASNRLDALNERLQLPELPVDEVRGGGKKAAADDGGADETAGDEPESLDEDDESPDGEDADEKPARPRARRTGAGGSGRTGTARSGARTATRSSGSTGAAPRRRRAQEDTDEPPVRRTRR